MYLFAIYETSIDKIDPSELTAKFYTLHVCLGIKIDNIVNATCNCKDGGAGFCVYVGTLLYTL
jgi:hypothetical protein